MNDALKPKIDLNRVAGLVVRPSGIDVSKILKQPKSGPTVLGPELKALFLKTADNHEKSIKERIESGQLDRNGNPIGTKYWEDDPNTPKRQRRPNSGPRRKIRIVTGMIFGDLIIRRKGPRIKAARPNLQERWRCECSCGRQIIVPRYYLLRTPNPKTHCGCKVQTLKSQNPREYRIYMMIHQRCFNEKHVSYKHYLSRGITLYEPWNNSHKDGFKKFFAEVGSAPSQWHSLDRIHNNRGYEPGNLRWATAEQQRANQGDRIGGYSSEQIADMGLTEDEFIEKILSGAIQ